MCVLTSQEFYYIRNTSRLLKVRQLQCTSDPLAIDGFLVYYCCHFVVQISSTCFVVVVYMVRFTFLLHVARYCYSNSVSLSVSPPVYVLCGLGLSIDVSSRKTYSISHSNIAICEKHIAVYGIKRMIIM